MDANTERYFKEGLRTLKEIDLTAYLSAKRYYKKTEESGFKVIDDMFRHHPLLYLFEWEATKEGDGYWRDLCEILHPLWDGSSYMKDSTTKYEDVVF